MATQRDASPTRQRHALTFDRAAKTNIAPARNSRGGRSVGKSTSRREKVL